MGSLDTVGLRCSKLIKNCRNVKAHFRPCRPSLLIILLGMRVWMGCGGGAAIRESTGRELRFPRRNQSSFRKERRKALGPAPSHGKTSALWFREARGCPRTPAPCSKHLIPLCFGKSEGSQAILEQIISYRFRVSSSPAANFPPVICRSIRFRPASKCRRISMGA